MASKLEKLPHARVRLTITVEADVLKKQYDVAIKKVAEHVEIKGFRKGHAPANMVIQKAGNGTILQEMIDLVLPDSYYNAIAEHKDLVPVSQPAIDVKELKDDPNGGQIPVAMTYTAEVDIMPEIQVGDYKKIKVKPKTAEDKIETKEIDGTIDEIKKMYGDDYLRAGNFKDDAEMRKMVEDNIRQQKIFQAESDTYDAIIEEALKKAKVEVPESMTHNEIHRMMSQIEMQAKAYGMTLEEWMKSQSKTSDDLHKEWHDQAEKAAKVGLVLGKIAEAEGIDPTQNDASRQVLDKLYEYAIGHKPGEVKDKK